ncbi:hypothetical protein [Brevundimonas sp.]|uniref:hypothetical protein n=1 Tax=Brevundimonas sp. TaxID=1871086 RepID=UPI0028ACA0A6|nr:hypothetical protein [Brevundimonas sp.]
MGEVKTKAFSGDDFRKELVKIMPGYDWTVHRQSKHFPELLEATGIKSSGFNRLSTLAVSRRERLVGVEYEAKSAGFGTRAPWLHTNRDGTLARTLRGLQQHYEQTAATFYGHAAALQSSRATQSPATEGGEGA